MIALGKRPLSSGVAEAFLASKDGWYITAQVLCVGEGMDWCQQKEEGSGIVESHSSISYLMLRWFVALQIGLIWANGGKYIQVRRMR